MPKHETSENTKLLQQRRTKSSRIAKSKSVQLVPSELVQRIEIRYPTTGDELSTVSALRSVMRQRKKVVVISGAGLSVSAVPDFQTLRKSTRSSFDISVYNSLADTGRFHAMVCDIWRRSDQSQPTAFHRFLDDLALNDYLLRHYTQNIDCLERYLPDLEGRTLRLHGRIDEVLCQYCGWKGSLVIDRFAGPETPGCERCRDIALERERAGKRARGIGRLRPNIVLYGEENPNGDVIEASVKHDLRAKPEVILVVGTALKVPGARKVVKELCRAVKAQGGVTAWINKDAPPSGLNICWDYILQGDCDEIASSLS